MRVPDPPHLLTIVVGADPLARSGLSASLKVVEDICITLQIHPDALAASADRVRDADALLWDLGLSSDPLPPSLSELDVPTLALVDTVSGAREALSTGAQGAIRRQSSPERIRASLLAIKEGAWVIDDAFINDLLGELERPSAPGLVEPLSPREEEVLELLAEGLSNRLIARRLGISAHTVKFHVNAILGKLDASSRTEAVVTAARLGILRL